jgi:CheY-like chemotaxis protein
MKNTLLAIDDSALHLSIVCKIAQQAGFTATGVTSASEARRALQESTFDCITLDLSLGEQSGSEIMHFLAEMKCPTPIVIVSGSTDDAREETVELGKLLKLRLCAPVAKPIDLAAFRNSLVRLAGEIERDKLAAPTGA